MIYDKEIKKKSEILNLNSQLVTFHSLDFELHASLGLAECERRHLNSTYYYLNEISSCNKKTFAFYYDNRFKYHCFPNISLLYIILIRS